MTTSPLPEAIQLPCGNALSLSVQVPTMKSLYIEMCIGDTILSRGTAFLAALNKEPHCALITNRHNVTGRHQETSECLSKTCGIPDNIRIFFHKQPIESGQWKIITLPLYRDDGTPWWIEHPKLGAKADVVALNLTWGGDVYRMPYYIGMELDRPGLLVAPGETVSVIGFPFGLSSFGKFPIWATGFLAQEMTLMTPDNPVFLVDCRTRQGQSGSPVIAHRAFGFRKIQGDKINSTLGATQAWEFLGIYSGRVNDESDLGRVWHVSVVEEVLKAAEAAYPRAKAPEASQKTAHD
ncbi:MAG: trypsin-like serine peptidase [Sulfobacillus sp.]